MLRPTPPPPPLYVLTGPFTPHHGSNAALACQNSRKWLGILRDDFFAGKKYNQRQAFEWVVLVKSSNAEALSPVLENFRHRFSSKGRGWLPPD